MRAEPSFTRFLLGLAAAVLIVLGLVTMVRHLRGREWGEELVASSIAECQQRVRAARTRGDTLAAGEYVPHPTTEKFVRGGARTCRYWLSRVQR
jgi:hypothetical protein